MTTFEIGRICSKTRGKEAGEKCIVVDIIDENYVMIDGPKTKRRRCNIRHLEPTDKTAKIKKGAKGKELEKALS